MSWMSYCRKCGVDVPRGDACPHCGARLTKAGEQLVTYREHVPVRDWFCWNRALRIALPVYLLVFALFVLLEAVTRGELGVQALLSGGFMAVMLGLLALLLALIGLTLLLQGKEVVKTVLDKDGARQWVYLQEPRARQLLARLVGKGTIALFQEDSAAMQGYVIVQRRALRWADVRRVGEWPENETLLLYRPRFWLCLTLRLPQPDYDEARAYIAKKCHIPAKKKKKKSK